jgi:plastocyanin
MRYRLRQIATGMLAAWIAGFVPPVKAADVTAQFSVATASGLPRAKGDASVVLWLMPLSGANAQGLRAGVDAPHAALVQKNKTFDPHVLAVQVGTEVDFPNRDPFFHNVFSLFNGKRFDLGLYEAGSTRGVHFDRTGICYIFCNIHPQMSAIVVVVGSPYFGVSGKSAAIKLSGVPAGAYRLNLWEERCAPATLAKLSRDISVGGEAVSLGNIQLQESEQPVTARLNKYGKPYDPDVFSDSLYTSQ